MSNGPITQFIGGRGAALQQQAQQQALTQGQQAFGLQQQQQQAELERFADRQNLSSMVQGALQLQNITDPAQQEAFIRKRISDIQDRGGDPRDTAELLGMNPQQRQQALQNVIGIGERFGIVKPGPQPKTEVFGRPHAAFVPGRGEVFIQTSQEGRIREVTGFQPIPKQGETIETTKEGGIRITRGGKTRKFSETQLNAAGFATRVNAANEILGSLENVPGFDPASIQQAALENVPIVGNLLISPERQQYNQAKLDFITANLRRESGAAISESEFAKEEKKFFPQPGDTKKVLDNKRKARERQFRILKGQSSGAFDEIDLQSDQPIESPQQQQVDVNMRAAQIQQENPNLTQDQLLDMLINEGF